MPTTRGSEQGNSCAGSTIGHEAWGLMAILREKKRERKVFDWFRFNLSQDPNQPTKSQLNLLHN